MSKYRLKHIENDWMGDEGGMSVFSYRDDTGMMKHEQNARPRVGGYIKVGSHYGRSYSSQDWWQTSMIMEILEDTPNYVKFRTMNSIYEWWCD